MSVFLKNVTFHGILLDSLFSGSRADKRLLQHLLAQGLEQGVVTPLPHQLFQWDQAEQAFRLVGTRMCIGPC